MTKIHKSNIIITLTALTIAVIIAVIILPQAYRTPNLTKKEEFPYTSYQINLERQFFAANFPKNIQKNQITLIAHLYLPQDARHPMPAVILQHGSGGNSLLKSWHKEITAALTAQHIAVLIADSHSARGLTSTANDQTALSSANRLLDAAQALKFLSRDPRIDPTRIAIAGDSYGGFITMRLAETAIINALTENRQKFAAHAMLYPACNATPETLDLTAAPMLMLLGGKDDYTIAVDCLKYSRRIKQKNYPLRTHIFQNAYHGWLYNIPPVKFARAQTFNRCRISFADDGNIMLIDYNISTADMDLRQFYDAVLHSGCVKTGAHVGGDRQARKESTAMLVDFFTDHLLKK